MSKHVLLIEDEPNIIEAVSFLLSRDGYNVSTHSNGHDALEVIEAKQPDLLILDVMLPGRSGFDILADLRGRETGEGIPVLMLTARGQTKDREMAQRIGATRFMTKPFSNAEIIETLNEMSLA
ncbi:MAG: response regulator [Planktotalea sp.]|jgi:DNA-binding response OmpR family regulator|uniref:response regulator transcription factor n=1 Tax=Planktotalea sp. TaxID=2029877 RepID=UPI0001839C0D|nr:response regulator [Planktotalea sp.]EDZ42066.1 response regulator receiver domain protein [Rhodobacteraceae bacterium HTCC2083]MBT5821983.1 response regulator [Paracoccaceae bacterium]MDG1075638.1 response regulator [Planktotalea sp.]MDG1085696.1 response regulator [Planktotalea sp.]HCW85801.1 response regulator [Paracoccaceae bacterium]